MALLNGDRIQDVVIIGGGPAGSTAATYLTMQGHSVTVLEKERFPRDHVGESLLPFCYGMFEEMGLLGQMTRRFVRKPGVQFVDSEGQVATSWCFERVIPDEGYLSFHVTRSEFDKLMLDNARKHGANVCEETRVHAVDLEEADGLVSVRAYAPDGTEQVHRGRFLLDASGRFAFMASRMRWRKPIEGLDRTALWTHWDNVELKGGLEDGLSLIVYLGGEKKGWIWVFPLGHHRVTVGVVVNNDHIRAEKTRLQDEGRDDWQWALYENELMLSSFVRDLLAGGQIAQPVTVEGDYSYMVEKKYGENFALIGDASTFIDPIFSSGVFLSMKGSKLIAQAVHTILEDGATSAEALGKAYGQINGAYGMVHRLIKLFYNPHAVNFAQAGTVVGNDHEEHKNAMAAGHYLLAGDFFEKHEQYVEFIELLQNPRLFDKYRKMVIERETFRDGACRADVNEIFPAALVGPAEPGD